jgi:hypothetical protein
MGFHWFSYFRDAFPLVSILLEFSLIGFLASGTGFH